MDQPLAPTSNLARVFLSLSLFGISFGFVEAAIVEYLRFVWQPVQVKYYPTVQTDSIFPILRLDQLRAEGAGHMRLLYTELWREAATLVMLGAAGLAAASNVRQWFAGFMFAFGVWDISFYMFLKVLLNWPESLITWDLLFLLPVPWVGPVWAPLAVSLAMIGAGVMIHWRDAIGRPVQIAWYHGVGITAGGVIIIVAFCWDWRNVAAGGLPNLFHWPLFLTGMLTGLSAFFHAVRVREEPQRDLVE